MKELPMMVYSGAVGDPESSVDGYLLYYNYGLVSLAQYWIEQGSARSGEQPAYWRYLGRIALLSGEIPLARRYFRRLARCPFRGEDAARHLRWCTPEGHAAFMELNRDLMQMAWVWYDQGARGNLPTFFTPTENAEHYVYTRFYLVAFDPETGRFVRPRDGTLRQALPAAAARTRHGREGALQLQRARVLGRPGQALHARAGRPRARSAVPRPDDQIEFSGHSLARSVCAFARLVTG